MLLNNSVIDIGLRITLQDRFSGPARDIKGALKGIKDEMQMYQDNLRSARNLYGSLAMAGGLAMSKIWSGFEKGAKFDYLVRGAAAASGATQEELKGLYGYANSLGSKMGFMPEKIAEAMRVLGLAGIDAKGVMVGIKPIMSLAGGSMEDLATSADIAISSMYQFGYKAKDLGYITDVLAQGSVKSNINLRDLGESLKYASSTAVLLGQDLPTVTAMIMTLGNAGMKGSMAGVGLENMYRYLSLGLGEFKKKGRSDTWAAIGINPDQMLDAKGDLKPMIDILHTLRSAIGKFGTVDQGNILYQIFGVRGKRPPAVFLEDLKLLEKNLKYTQNAKGVAETLYEKQMKGPYGALVKMAAAFAEMVNAFAKTLEPVIMPFLKMVTGALNTVRTVLGTGFGQVVAPILAAVLTFKTLGWSIRALAAILNLNLYGLRTNLVAIRQASNISMGAGLRGLFGIGMPRGAAPTVAYNNGKVVMPGYHVGGAYGRTYVSKDPNARLPFRVNAQGQALTPTGLVMSRQAASLAARQAGLISISNKTAAGMIAQSHPNYALGKVYGQTYYSNNPNARLPFGINSKGQPIGPTGMVLGRGTVNALAQQAGIKSTVYPNSSLINTQQRPGNTITAYGRTYYSPNQIPFNVNARGQALHPTTGMVMSQANTAAMAKAYGLQTTNAFRQAATQTGRAFVYSSNKTVAAFQRAAISTANFFRGAAASTAAANSAANMGRAATGLLGAGAIFSRVGGVLATAGRGLMGALGGPWGLAITGLSIGIPLIYNALNRNTDAINENTKVIDDSFHPIQRYNLPGPGNQSVLLQLRKLYDYREEQRMKSPDYVPGPVRPIQVNPTPINLYVGNGLAAIVKGQINTTINNSLLH